MGARTHYVHVPQQEKHAVANCVNSSPNLASFVLFEPCRQGFHILTLPQPSATRPMMYKAQ